jgi:hypothetical protein
MKQARERLVEPRVPEREGAQEEDELEVQQTISDTRKDGPLRDDTLGPAENVVIVAFVLHRFHRTAASSGHQWCGKSGNEARHDHEQEKADGSVSHRCRHILA